MRMTGVAHPITHGLEGFNLPEEAYAMQDYVPGIEALATVQATSQDRAWPGLWARELGPARVVYDALGHDSASFNHPTHSRIVRRCALWALRRSDADIQRV
jgi:type 1 glutamine amidotransferase